MQSGGIADFPGLAFMPTTLPPWQVVQKTFARWAAAGGFKQIQNRLPKQWRSHTEREDAPTAAVTDARDWRRPEDLLTAGTPTLHCPGGALVLPALSGPSKASPYEQAREQR